MAGNSYQKRNRMKKTTPIKPEDLYSAGIISKFISDVTIEKLEEVEDGLCEFCGGMFEDRDTVRSHFLGTLEDNLELAYPVEPTSVRSSQDDIRNFSNVLCREYGIGSRIDKDGNLGFTYDGTSFRLYRNAHPEAISFLTEVERDGQKAVFYTNKRAVGATLVTGCVLPQALVKADYVHRRILADIKARKVAVTARGHLA